MKTTIEVIDARWALILEGGDGLEIESFLASSGEERHPMSKLADYGIEIDPVIEAYKKNVDRTLIRENLKLTVQERFEKLIALQHFTEELRAAGRKARGRS